MTLKVQAYRIPKSKRFDKKSEAYPNYSTIADEINCRKDPTAQKDHTNH